jgi:hypothetical protein
VCLLELANIETRPEFIGYNEASKKTIGKKVVEVDHTA